ncbi:MAG: hypothetical protein OQJ89_03315, partial [Kangiellaceae bacterium]|nr:hypothetical protein [Kangiellaceae bacterium]
IGAKYLLDFDISRATKIGTGGIEFSEQQERTSEATEELDRQLKEAIARIAILEKRLDNPTNQINENERRQILEEAAQEVSPAVAKLSKSAEKGGKSLVYNVSGYIWIGNFKDKWQKPVLIGLDGQIIQKSPDSINPGEQYTTRGNMVIREQLPQDNKDYYKGSRSLGTIPVGTRVRIEEIPEGIDREFAVQYWAKVVVLE